MLASSLQRQIYVFISVIGLGATIVIGALYLIFGLSGSIEDSWKRYTQENSKKQMGLELLVTELGFGGMIHQFKNYVIRQDEGRIQKVHTAVGGARNAINVYHHGNLTSEESEALDTVETAINAYSNAMVIAVEMVRNEATPVEIDQAVKISDGPALEAIETLFAATGSNTETDKARLLIGIRRGLGYGGMIHQFKN